MLIKLVQNVHLFKSIFHCTCCNTPKRVTGCLGPSPRHCARATQSFRRNFASMYQYFCRKASRWEHCVRFDRPEIWISDLPLQRRTRYIRPTGPYVHLFTIGGVENTRLEAKTRTQKKSEAKDSPSEDRHTRGQRQESSRPRPRT